LKSSSLKPAIFCSISAVVKLRNSLAFICFTTQFFTLHELRFDRKFVSCKSHRLACDFFAYACQLEKDFARLDNGNPFLDVTFTATHTNFKRLLRNWLGRENFDPYFTAPLDVTSHRNTGSF